MAGGMGWGIRGQYGHETGAMIAGVLVGFTLVLLFVPKASSLGAARAVALCALGVCFGGAMTYGQTVGLTHNPGVIGNWGALGWGLLGLFVKGGIWIGLAGAFLGIGLSGKRYGPWEMLAVLAAMLGLFVVGIWTLNAPFHPTQQILPTIYFSADWVWEPGAELKPRPECWGGLLAALVGLTAYVQWGRKDALARNMALWGFLGGGLGFSVGQCVQAFHAWNRELLDTGDLAPYFAHINWWNMMETSFGAIFGGVLALGLWLNRRKIAVDESPDEVTLSPIWEAALFCLFVFVILGGEFWETPALAVFVEYSLLIGLIPLVGILVGRYWPYLFALPGVAATIAGKTLRNLCYEHAELSKPLGWTLLVALPLLAALAVALWLSAKGKKGQSSRDFARIGLLFCTWLYFILNYAFFRLPWPWTEWTGRTPSGIIFTVCAIGLTVAAVVIRDEKKMP